MDQLFAMTMALALGIVVGGVISLTKQLATAQYRAIAFTLLVVGAVLYVWGALLNPISVLMLGTGAILLLASAAWAIWGDLLV